jgi:hypothetical protein
MILSSVGLFRPVFGVTYAHGLANRETPQRSCMRRRTQYPAHAFDNALVFAALCTTTSMRFASALRLLVSSVRTFASTP